MSSQGWSPQFARTAVFSMTDTSTDPPRDRRTPAFNARTRQASPKLPASQRFTENTSASVATTETDTSRANNFRMKRMLPHSPTSIETQRVPLTKTERSADNA